MLRVISDCHGNRKEYLDIIKDCEASLQIGDLGFEYDFLGEVDFIKHKVIAGNHDNHDVKRNYPHFLLDFGVANLGGIKFFFLEGAFSIDQELRREREELLIWPKTWWENEELPQHVLEDALRIYKEVSPDILISHEPTRTIADKLGSRSFIKDWGFDPDNFTTRTGECLERMINAHTPKLHIFGHFHINYDEVIDGCRYICQEELGYLDLYEDLSIDKYSYSANVDIE